MKQILVGIQDLLDTPNPADPAQTDGYHLFIQVLTLIDGIVYETYEPKWLWEFMILMEIQISAGCSWVQEKG